MSSRVTLLEGPSIKHIQCRALFTQTYVKRRINKANMNTNADEYYIYLWLSRGISADANGRGLRLASCDCCLWGHSVILG